MVIKVNKTVRNRNKFNNVKPNFERITTDSKGKLLLKHKINLEKYPWKLNNGVRRISKTLI